ncbi:unnamed protein product [Bubo scandiacus]
MCEGRGGWPVDIPDGFSELHSLCFSSSAQEQGIVSEGLIVKSFCRNGVEVNVLEHPLSSGRNVMFLTGGQGSTDTFYGCNIIVVALVLQ